MIIQRQTSLRSTESEGSNAGGTGLIPDGNAPAQSSEPVNSPGKSGFNPFAPSKPAAASPTPAVAASSAPAAKPVLDASPDGLGAGGATSVADPQTGAAAPITSPQVPPVQQLTLSPEAIAALRVQAAPAQQAVAPSISDAEFKKMFNIHEVDAKRFSEIHGFEGTPQQLAAYNDSLQAVARQSVTIARHLMDQQKKELMAMMAPVQNTIQTQLEEKYTNEFYVQYPHLKDYHSLCQEIVRGIRARGQTFDSPQSASKFVAETAMKLAKIQAPAMGAAPVGTQQQPSVQPAVSRPMTTVSTGGRSGTGGSATPPKTTAARIFGE